MRRNVVYLPPQRAGIFVWTFVLLFYFGIVLPLVAVCLFFKYTVLAVVWVIHQLHLMAVRAPRRRGDRAPLDPRRGTTRTSVSCCRPTALSSK